MDRRDTWGNPAIGAGGPADGTIVTKIDSLHAGKFVSPALRHDAALGRSIFDKVIPAVGTICAPQGGGRPGFINP